MCGGGGNALHDEMKLVILGRLHSKPGHPVPGVRMNRAAAVAEGR